MRAGEYGFPSFLIYESQRPTTKLVCIARKQNVRQRELFQCYWLSAAQGPYALCSEVVPSVPYCTV